MPHSYPTHPGVIVEERSGADHGEDDDDGPEKVAAAGGRPVHDVLPAVQRGLLAKRPESVLTTLVAFGRRGGVGPAGGGRSAPRGRCGN